MLLIRHEGIVGAARENVQMKRTDQMVRSFWFEGEGLPLNPMPGWVGGTEVSCCRTNNKKLPHQIAHRMGR